MKKIKIKKKIVVLTLYRDCEPSDEQNGHGIHPTVPCHLAKTSLLPGSNQTLEMRWATSDQYIEGKILNLGDIH